MSNKSWQSHLLSFLENPAQTVRFNDFHGHNGLLRYHNMPWAMIYPETKLALFTTVTPIGQGSSYVVAAFMDGATGQFYGSPETYVIRERERAINLANWQKLANKFPNSQAAKVNPYAGPQPRGFWEYPIAHAYTYVPLASLNPNDAQLNIDFLNTSLDVALTRLAQTKTLHEVRSKTYRSLDHAYGSYLTHIASPFQPETMEQRIQRLGLEKRITTSLANLLVKAA